MPFSEIFLKNINFAATLQESALPGINSIPTSFFNLTPTISDITSFSKFKGSYTPTNDMLTIVSGLTVETAPNFLMIFCDAPLVVTAVDSNTEPFLTCVPVTDFIYLPLPANPPENAGVPLVNLILEGRTSAARFMQQGFTVNYIILMGQGTVS